MHEPCGLAEQAEQELDDRAEDRVDAEEEDGEQVVMISTMIAVVTVSLRVGQTTLAVFGADLADEFAGG